jgi:ribosomal protein L29
MAEKTKDKKQKNKGNKKQVHRDDKMNDLLIEFLKQSAKKRNIKREIARMLTKNKLNGGKNR